MKKGKENKHPGWRTTRNDRFHYLTGNLARGFNSTVFTSTITIFLMMQGINLAALAAITLLVKIVDSVDDVLFGFIIDRIDPTKIKSLQKFLGSGKYLPWYKLTFWMFPLATILFYLMPSSWSINGKIAWYAVTYLLFDLTYTLCEVPMNTMIMTITDNMDERHHIQTLSAIWTVVGAIVVSAASNFLISEYVGMPIREMGIGFAIFFTILMIPLAVKGKEYNVSLKNIDDGEEETYTFKQMILCLKDNKYLFIYLISLFVMTVLIALNSAMGLFVGFYIFDNSQASTIAILIAFIPSLIMMGLAPKLAKKVGGNQRMIVSMSLLYALVYVLMFFLAKGNIIVFIVLTILTTIPNSFLGVVRSFIIPDLIEYSRYKSRQDCSGIFYALLSFVNKMMNSIGSSIGLFILGFCGWVTVNATDFADLAAQNVVQPESAINMLWCISTLLPAIGCVLGAVIMLFYKLKDKDTQLMAQCNAGDITREECEAQLSRKY